MNNSASTLLQIAFIKSAAGKWGKGEGGSIPQAVPNKMVTVTQPPGMEWDRPEQEHEYQNLIKKLRPDLSGHLVRGHGGGPSGAFQVRPRSRSVTDVESLLLNARNTRTLPEVLQAMKRTHGGIPDLLFLGQCNKQNADIPQEIEDSLGDKPNRLVYTAPGGYSNTGVSREALKYVLNTRRPLFVPEEKEFTEGAAKVRAALQPVVPLGVSVPGAGAGIAMLVNEVIQRTRKKKNSWGRRLAFGAGGAALGTLGLLAASELQRSRARNTSEIRNFRLPDNSDDTPLIRPV